VPECTTSFYFRTRAALLRAVAERVAELDLKDLTAATSAPPVIRPSRRPCARTPRFYALIRADAADAAGGRGISGTVVEPPDPALMMFISGVMLTRSSGKDGCGRRRSWIAYSRESSQVLRCNMIRRRSLSRPPAWDRDPTLPVRTFR
jgi:hypothetical protein